jgi:hypothetical protein
MTETQEQILRDAGWTVTCESPLELHHKATGSIATQWAADAVIGELEAEAERFKQVLRPEELANENFESLVTRNANALVMAVLYNGIKEMQDVLQDAYRELDAWQVSKKIRTQPRVQFRTELEIREEAAVLVDRLLRQGSSGLHDKLFGFMTAFAQSY